MPRTKPENEEQRQRRRRAAHWKLFRKNNLLTQKKLAEVVGISRRTVQLIEGGYITPQMQTLRRFAPSSVSKAST